MIDGWKEHELDGHREYVVQIKENELALSHNYIFRLETWHDGELKEVDFYSDAITAVTSFAKCCDVGLAEKTADYVLIQPNAKVTTKSFSRPVSHNSNHNSNHHLESAHKGNVLWLNPLQ
jgi:hypothetical protein